ncbi:AAA family ATPase [Pseudomonas protegens]|uniref:AAA family ATPase n=1 Tax=Pseudomonas protegens TaxID=380021 RepID=UPI00227835EF|nr:AAA family ATPase [Pseudomonas protegens]
MKDAQAGRTSSGVIPNMMRNILEYYFTFVHRQDELQAVLMALSDEDAEFKALYRYVNRESHSDAVNLTDFGEIVPSHYVDRFRQVFVRAGFEEHYEKMMGEQT